MNTHAIVPEPGTVRLERLLPGPIERVWSYLTDSEKRAKWFAGGPIELRVGGVAELTFDHRRITDEPPSERYANMGTPVGTGHVTACEPPRLLSFTWWENEGDGSEVTFELRPEGEKVLLTVLHRRLPNRGEMVNVAAGWHAHVDLLNNLLEGRSENRFWTEHSRLEDYYDQQISEKDALSGAR